MKAITIVMSLFCYQGTKNGQVCDGDVGERTILCGSITWKVFLTSCTVSYDLVHHKV